MLCSALRRAAVGWESFANVSCERIASFWPRNRVLARIGLFGRVSENRDLAFCRQGPSQGFQTPPFRARARFRVHFRTIFLHARHRTDGERKTHPKRRSASCARIPKGRGSCVRIPQERGLTMAETLALGGEGASELPFCQRGRRRIGKARRADLARPCPFELRFAALRGSPGRGNWGHPPLHRSRSDGIERGRGSVSSRLEKGCRPAIPHGSFPLSAPKVRMRCRRARVSGEGGASLPAHARQKCGPLALPIAARLHVSHRGRADTPWPFPFRRALFAASCRISFASRSAIFAANLVKPSFLS